MTEQEQRALLALVLMAAGADGHHESREAAEIARVAASLSSDGAVKVAAIHDDVRAGRITLAEAAGAIAPAQKQAAYEACAAVCAADGVHDAGEQAFLASLATALGLDPAVATAFNATANAIAVAPVSTISRAEPAAAAGGDAGTSELDRIILNYAILNGALELFPDTLSSTAILPLQMRMVFRIGKAHGVELDKSSIKELLATAGVGLTSQYVEQIGVSIVGKLFGRGLLGGLLGSLAGQSVSSGMSFATTYALGRLAVRYYSGGRSLSTQMLKETYDGLLREGRSLQGQHFTDIQERARTVNLKEIMSDALA